MHTVEVALENVDGLRLSLCVSVSVRNTPYENAACKEAELRANGDASHSKYGPWIAKSSHYIS